jgi:eukaryotic-like serine/threonine-protein kinase
MLAAGLATVAVAMSAMGFALIRRTPPGTQPVRFLLDPPGSVAFSATGFVAVSPDGTRLALVATGPTGTPMLWIRPLDSLSAEPLPQTEYARAPFWSPDSRFIGYVAYGKLWKIAASGGLPQAITDTAEIVMAATWNQQG